MSLRNRLLALFTAFGILPLCALGGYQYVRTQRAVEALVGTQTAQLAERATTRITDRWSRLRSDLLLVAGNTETERIYAARGDSLQLARALGLAAPFFRDLWQQIGAGYEAIELRDARGRRLFHLGEPERDPAGSVAIALNTREFVREPASGAIVGVVVASPRLDALLPADVLAARFGEAGYSIIVDRATGLVLYHPRHAGLNQRLQTLLRADSLAARRVLSQSGRGRFTSGRGDSTRVASWVSLDEPPWSVIVSASVPEFGTAFARLRREALAVVLLVAVLMWAAFTLASRRATRSLQALTRAADQVGRGNFAPVLPPAGRDEVGRLAQAFQAMTGKVAEMVTQLERSRQLAAIGEFAAELSHEIRNPLTALKLNLQRIERSVRGERDPAGAAAPLAISLREIDRLDRVVSGILHLGRPHTGPRSVVPLRAVAEQALAVTSEQAAAQHVEIATEFPVPDDVAVDAEELRAAILNLLVNALEAMAGGGRLRLWTEAAGAEVALVIEDSGPGIPAAERARLFHPFHTTKPHGTGLGLAAALRTVEAHGGHLTLVAPRHGAGAAFCLQLPLASVEVTT